MANRSRIRRLAKWTGVVACAVFLVGWAVSEYVTIVYLYGKFGIFIAGGDLSIDWRTVPYPSHGWGLYPPGSMSARIWPFLLRSVRDPGGPLGPAMLVPLYFPLLFVALPTGYLFYRDRRYPPGHCLGCGYNLKGNVSGVCPECGCAVGN